MPLGEKIAAAEYDNSVFFCPKPKLMPAQAPLPLTWKASMAQVTSTFPELAHDFRLQDTLLFMHTYRRQADIYKPLKVFIYQKVGWATSASILQAGLAWE